MELKMYLQPSSSSHYSNVSNCWNYLPFSYCQHIRLDVGCHCQGEKPAQTVEDSQQTECWFIYFIYSTRCNIHIQNHSKKSNGYIYVEKQRIYLCWETTKCKGLQKNACSCLYKYKQHQMSALQELFRQICVYKYFLKLQRLLKSDSSYLEHFEKRNHNISLSKSVASLWRCLRTLWQPK